MNEQYIESRLDNTNHYFAES